MIRVSIYGAGQLGTAVGLLLDARPGVAVLGPFGRDQRESALGNGAAVVVIATTTRLADVIEDVTLAVRSGSNVITSAEEAAYPFAADADAAARVDALAREAGVTVVGAGVNPGFLFDALVLTMLGAAPPGCTIRVRRVVDISGFGPAVLRRIGVGLTPHEFDSGVAAGTVFGHAGFPQSMAVVASALGLRLDRVDRVLRPLTAKRDVDVPNGLRIDAGQTVGVDQRYTGVVGGVPWFTAEFFGHVALDHLDMDPSDEIELLRGGAMLQRSRIRPGVGAQVGSANMIANSIERVVAAQAGWRTVAELMPAYPRLAAASFVPT